ncbi:Uncharacterised protein [Klebsiella oxytoca]|nr:Uncharacterised protein [Klebsiella oxytoca]
MLRAAKCAFSRLADAAGIGGKTLHKELHGLLEGGADAP